MRFFLGTVSKFDKDTWSISFQSKNTQGASDVGIISNISDNDLPIAFCIGPHVTEPLIDSAVLIIQFNDNLDEFGWWHIDRSDSVGIYYKGNNIDIGTDGSIILEVKDGNTSKTKLELNKSGTGLKLTTSLPYELNGPSNSKISVGNDGKVSINNHLTVTI